MNKLRKLHTSPREKLIAVLIGLAVLLVLGGGTAGAGEKQVKRQPTKTKRYYEVMWAANPALCEKVRAYADRERTDYMPITINYGNVKWTELDDPSRVAVNVTLAGESAERTVFRWVLTRKMGLEWDYALDAFPSLINFADLAKDPASFAGKQEWRFEPDDAELTGLNGQKSPKPSKWCAKLKDKDRDLGCKGKHPTWRFSFFDLIKIDGKTYITAATEKYQSPDDINLPVVILVGRYIAPSPDKPQPLHGNNGAMSQLEHRCYLIKTK
jgi:hypothetical protein